MGHEWTVGEGEGVETWTCDNVTWTGLRCCIALNDGTGRYRDLTLAESDAATIAAFIAATQARLDADWAREEAERLAAEEFCTLVGEEI